METQSVKFIKYHPAFSHGVGEVADLLKGDAKYLLDNGFVTVATEADKKETAVAGTFADYATKNIATEKATQAAAEQRAIAHGLDKTTVTIGTELGPMEAPVATDAQGNKTLGKPEDQALVDAAKTAKK